MKTIEIIGDNYGGKWKKTRTACRGIVIEESKMLLSYETKTRQWMIPGGGLEHGESDRACCVREVAEETGMVVDASACMLQIDEYYEDCKWVNKYFICKVIGTTGRKLTKREMDVGMEPQWLPIEEIREIFSKYRAYADTDEMRRGLYFREFTALNELIPGR